jgi:hypothetical protein
LWRKTPERPESTPPSEASFPAEPLNQTIQFLSGQSTQTKQAGTADADPQGNKGGLRAAKRRKRGGGGRGGLNGAQDSEQGPVGSEAQGLVLRSGAEGAPLDTSKARDQQALADPTKVCSLYGAPAVGSGGEGPGFRETVQRQTVGGQSAIPVTDLTLQWQAEIERGHAQVWGPASDRLSPPGAADSRFVEPRDQLTGSARKRPSDPSPNFRAEQVADLSDRVQVSQKGFAVEDVSTGRDRVTARPCHSLSAQPEASLQQRRPDYGASLPRQGGYPQPSVADIQRRSSTRLDSGQAASDSRDGAGLLFVETLSEDAPAGERSASVDSAEEAAATGRISWSRPPLSSLRETQQQAPANGILPPGGHLPHASVCTRTHHVPLGAEKEHGAPWEAIYEDEMGYLLFVSLPFTELKQVRVSWRNVGEAGIVKVAGLEQSSEIARGGRVLRLVNRSLAGGVSAKEILLP